VVGSLTPRSATLHSSDDSFSHLRRIRVRHSSTPQIESRPTDSLRTLRTITESRSEGV
jgi:hypothetical protein